MAYYPFNGNANDASGNGNDGTVNGATLTTDRFGNAENAYIFNGSSNFIRVPDTDTLEGNNIKTVAVWIKKNGRINNKQNYSVISKYQNDAEESGWIVTAPTDDAGTTLLSGWSKGPCPKVSYEISLNEWFFVVYTVEENGDSFVSKLFVNGTTVNQTQKMRDDVSDIYLQGNVRDMLIGAAFYYNGEISPYSYFHGQIDNIRIYNRALSEVEIQALYKNR